MPRAEFSSAWRSLLFRTILPVVVTFCLVAGAAYLVVMPILEEHLMTGKRDMIRELTNAVCQLLGDYQRRVDSGELTLEDAQERAKKRITAIRHGADLRDYFWVTDANLLMLVHPTRPDMVGQYTDKFVDPGGKNLFVDMKAVVEKTGEGYVQYQWPSKDEPDKMVPKLTFAKRFEPWGWIVGTGVYLDDVRAVMATTTRRLGGALGALLGVVALVLWYIVWQGVRSEQRRLNAERALRDSERRLKDIVDFLPDATFAIDLQGRVTAWNRAMEGLTGVSAPEVLGQNQYAHSVPFYGERRATLIDMVLEGEELTRRDYPMLRKEGDRLVTELYAPALGGQGRYLNASASPLYNAGGETVGAIESVRDVTREVKLQEQLRQAQKMESIGRLAGGVAHDLNNLLSPILGYAEMLLTTFDASDSRSDEVKEIERAATRARNLTRQLLAFGRRQVLEMKNVDLSDVVAGFEGILRRTIREDIKVCVSLSSAIGCIRADAAQLEQVLMNLAVNAQDAMPDGGTMTIETADVVLDEGYAESHPEVTPGEYVMLALRDTGVGMDSETRKHVFEPFFTTKEVGKGTGLGLSTVYGIVNQHKGSIWLYSEPGKGTVVKMYFPRVEGEADVTQAVETPTGEVAGRETVLVAEDDPSVGRLVKKALEKRGYRVMLAESGPACIRALDEYEGAVDLLVTDVIMPEMNGRQLYEQLHLKIPGLRVVYMSGYLGDAIARHGVLDPGIDLLEKPISLQALVRKVREVLDRHPALE